MAISKALASYGLGPLERLPEYCCREEARYWSGRSVRIAGRDILLVVLYLPPGEQYAQVRRDTMQDLALLIKSSRGCWAIVGDWNQSPEALAATGFATFLQGTILTAGSRATCRQGKGSVIDYAVVNHGLAGAVAVELDEDTPWSPH